MRTLCLMPSYATYARYCILFTFREKTKARHVFQDSFEKPANDMAQGAQNITQTDIINRSSGFHVSSKFGIN